MNHIDVNKQQIYMYGNSVQLPQPEASLFRTLVTEMARSGKYDDAIKMLVDTIEEMEKRIKELEKNEI